MQGERGLLWLIAFGVEIQALGVVFENDSAVLLGAILALMFGLCYVIYDPGDQRATPPGDID